MHPKPSGTLVADVIAWDTVNWSVALDLWSDACGADMRDQEALEVGAHDGGVSLWLALQASGSSAPTWEALHPRHGPCTCGTA